MPARTEREREDTCQGGSGLVPPGSPPQTGSLLTALQHVVHRQHLHREDCDLCRLAVSLAGPAPVKVRAPVCGDVHRPDPRVRGFYTCRREPGHRGAHEAVDGVEW